MISGPTLVPSFLSGDADFRTWAQAVHDKIVAAGLVQTADTGQLTIGTATRPAISTAAGYEIWRFADSLQATAPVFVKLEYGVSNPVDRPSLWITVGAGTNGAGTINQQATTRNQCATGVSESASSTKPLEASGDTGRLFLVGNQIPATATAAYGFFIERTKDPSGTPTGDGIVAGPMTSGGVSWAAIPFSGTVPGFSSQPQSPTAGGLSAVGANVVVLPLLTYLGKIFYSWCGAMNPADIAGDQVFQAQMFGTLHTFRTVRGSTITTFLWE